VVGFEVMFEVHSVREFSSAKMKNRFGACVLPAEGVKMENSSMVKVEGAEQACLVKVGRAEERLDKARMRNVRINMVAVGGIRCGGGE
jgi:hypothetical protein